MFCRKCGAELPAEAGFCPRCGLRADCADGSGAAGEGGGTKAVRSAVPPFDPQKVSADPQVRAAEQSVGAERSKPINGMGMAGMIVAVAAALFVYTPLYNGLLGFLIQIVGDAYLVMLCFWSAVGLVFAVALAFSVFGLAVFRRRRLNVVAVIGATVSILSLLISINNIASYIELLRTIAGD